GHALGMNHQHQYVCATGSLRRDANGTLQRTGAPSIWEYDPTKCVYDEYGHFNLMGASPGNHPDPFTKLFVGAASPASLTTVTSSGTHTLQPIASASNGPKFLRIATTTPDRYFYFDYRAALANTFDADLGPGMQGVVVHEAPDYVARQQACVGQADCS